MSSHSDVAFIERLLVSHTFLSDGSAWSISGGSLVILRMTSGGKRHLRHALKWNRHPVLVLESLEASSEQLWEPEGTPKVAQGASRLNPKLSGGRG